MRSMSGSHSTNIGRGLRSTSRFCR
jgi:hypothetical protein